MTWCFSASPSHNLHRTGFYRGVLHKRKTCLKRNGLTALNMTGSLSYYSIELKELNLSIMNTLTSVFPISSLSLETSIFPRFRFTEILLASLPPFRTSQEPRHRDKIGKRDQLATLSPEQAGMVQLDLQGHVSGKRDFFT